MKIRLSNNNILNTVQIYVNYEIRKSTSVIVQKKSEWCAKV